MPVAAGEVDFFKKMEQEFCGVEDADVEFETYNYGGLRTTLRQEWEYVVRACLCNCIIRLIASHIDRRTDGGKSHFHLILCFVESRSTRRRARTIRD